jgi:hypothetical protein
MRPIEYIAARQEYRCTYCQHPMQWHIHRDGIATPRNAITKDHITPRVYGGPTFSDNLVAACCQCNNLRGEIDATTFRNLIAKWFKREPELWRKWHDIDHATFAMLKQRCLIVYEAQLRGQGKKHRDLAFRHYEFTWRERRRLRQQEPVCT